MSWVRPSLVKPKFKPRNPSRVFRPNFLRRSIISSCSFTRFALVIRPTTCCFTSALNATLLVILKKIKFSTSFCIPITTSPWMSSSSSVAGVLMVGRKVLAAGPSRGVRETAGDLAAVRAGVPDQQMLSGIDSVRLVVGTVQRITISNPDGLLYGRRLSPESPGSGRIVGRIVIHLYVELFKTRNRLGALALSRILWNSRGTACGLVHFSGIRIQHANQCAERMIVYRCGHLSLLLGFVSCNR